MEHWFYNFEMALNIVIFGSKFQYSVNKLMPICFIFYYIGVKL
jgi:hypothetical protein